jgi:hypothetical protein
MAASLLGMISCYVAVVLAKLTGLNTALFVARASKWSVRLAWTGTIVFAFSFLVFLIFTIGDYFIHGDRPG